MTKFILSFICSRISGFYLNVKDVLKKVSTG